MLNYNLFPPNRKCGAGKCNCTGACFERGRAIPRLPYKPKPIDVHLPSTMVPGIQISKEDIRRIVREEIMLSSANKCDKCKKLFGYCDVKVQMGNALMCMDCYLGQNKNSP